MDERVYIAVASGLIVAGLWLTGLWRLGFALFGIRSRQMTVERLGLRVATSADRERINALLHHFAGGFNKMISAPRGASCDRYCASLPELFRPFAEEGVAMGYTLRHLFVYRPAAFEQRLVKRRPEFRYLYYVGLGFWSGMRNHDARRLERIAEGLDPLHRYLCFDGYGFQRAFFDYRKNPRSFERLCALDGYARHVAFQGVGRAFFFLYMADVDLMIEHIRKQGVHAADVAAGVGLAAVFVYPDRLNVARDLASKMPQEWHHDFHLGMCFGLKARSINHVEQFERDMTGYDADIQEAVFASIRECDRVELLVRSRRAPDAYRCWREEVATWMDERVVYPLSGLRNKGTGVPIHPTSDRVRDTFCGSSTPDPSRDREGADERCRR